MTSVPRDDPYARLAHGTSERALDRILRAGVLPRARRGSNWAVRSNPRRVYLSDCYAPYFAMSAARKGDRWALVEVDLSLVPQSENLMLPDEDFLEQASRGHDGRDWTIERRTRYYDDNAWTWQDRWRMSLEHLGTAALAAPVPPEAIVRAALFDPARSPGVAALVDPAVTLANHAICGDTYRAVTRWMLGDQVRWRDLLLFPDHAERLDPDRCRRLADEVQGRGGLQQVRPSGRQRRNAAGP